MPIYLGIPSTSGVALFHNPEIMFGVLIAIFHLDGVAAQGCLTR